jgi:hypothetical protein
MRNSRAAGTTLFEPKGSASGGRERSHERWLQRWLARISESREARITNPDELSRAALGVLGLTTALHELVETIES